MKLRSLREHYTKKNNKTWKPKRAFRSKDEIKEQLGFSPEDVLTYRCRVCGYLHLKSPKGTYVA